MLSVKISSTNWRVVIENTKKGLYPLVEVFRCSPFAEIIFACSFEISEKNPYFKRLSPVSLSLSASFKTFCLTARAYFNTQKYGLFYSLITCRPRALISLIFLSQSNDLTGQPRRENSFCTRLSYFSHCQKTPSLPFPTFDSSDRELLATQQPWGLSLAGLSAGVIVIWASPFPKP